MRDILFPPPHARLWVSSPEHSLACTHTHSEKKNSVSKIPDICNNVQKVFICSYFIYLWILCLEMYVNAWVIYNINIHIYIIYTIYIYITISGQEKRLVGKPFAALAWWLQFGPWNPCKGERKNWLHKVVPCLLTSSMARAHTPPSPQLMQSKRKKKKPKLWYKFQGSL